MNYLITFFRERFYKGNEFIVLKPYYEVHLCVLFINLLAWVPNTVLLLLLIKKQGFEKILITKWIPILFCIFVSMEIVLLIIFECQYVKITEEDIKVIELFFFHKTMKLADILEKEVIAGNVGFRIASKNDEIIIRIFHLSKDDIKILYDKVGYEPKKRIKKTKK